MPAWIFAVFFFLNIKLFPSRIETRARKETNYLREVLI
jgi:hypothetical protein